MRGKTIILLIVLIGLLVLTSCSSEPIYYPDRIEITSFIQKCAIECDKEFVYNGSCNLDVGTYNAIYNISENCTVHVTQIETGKIIGKEI